MTRTEHKAILVELDAFITKLEKISDENGKNDPKHPHISNLIDRLAEAFVDFEYNDDELDEE